MNDEEINIMLVEDDEVDIMNVKRAFKKNDITSPFTIAHNGIEALDMLKGNEKNNISKIDPTPNIILLDINMPKMGGIEFLQKLREDPELRTITVFIMTTSDEESDKVAAYNYNVAGYILKPLSFEQFVNTISVLKDFWKLSELL